MLAFGELDHNWFTIAKNEKIIDTTRSLIEYGVDLGESA